MPDFTKHRREAIDVAVDFSDALDPSDSIATVDSVIITARDAPGTDVASQFGSPSGTINGDAVEFTLAVAGTSSAQDDGLYDLLVVVTTAGGDTLVAMDSEGRLPTIYVSTEGDPAV